MARLVVIGAGAMGLAAAYHGLKAGHTVELLEAAPEPGGMAAHFDFDGISIERFYHFVCKADQPTFDLLDELGMGDQMRWRTTTMGFFSDGKLHEWGNPVALLRYPGVGLLARLRYGLLAFVSTRRDHWAALENQSAKEWITRWAGREAYDKLWRRLFELKFYEYADNVSAAWIWTRVRRIGRSRDSLFEERLGYIEGGSQALVNRLMERITALGGSVHLSTQALRVTSEGGRVTGVEANDGFHAADAVISTVPTPHVAALVPDLPPEWKERYAAIRNIGVCCLLFKLRKSVSPHFWVNISASDVPVPGIIEFSNLRQMPNGETIVFVPYYMPTTNEKFSWPDERLLDEAFLCIQKVNPAISVDDILARKVARLRYAQPICEPGFAAKLPAIQTPIAGLQVADTCFYYPEDRGISESVRLAGEMVRHLSREPVEPAR
ncbi:MAG: NAD(P)/FAD-dependent oxidoreductase [Steroidobacteraceae bacterium]